MQVKMVNRLAAIIAGIVEGVANGCRENGCVLLGGETALVRASVVDDDDLGDELSRLLESSLCPPRRSSAPR